MNDFYYFPRKNGEKLGRVPVFLYTGPQYISMTVNEVIRRAFEDYGPPDDDGKYLVKVTRGNNIEKYEFLPYTNEAETHLHDKLAVIYDEQRAKFAEFMKGFDYTDIPQEDIELAKRTELLNPQVLSYSIPESPYSGRILTDRN